MEGRGHAPRRYARPAENLDVVWRKPFQGPWSLGTHLIATTSPSAVQEIDPATGATSRLFAPNVHPLPGLSTDAPFIGAEAGPWVTAVDPKTERALWRVRCNDMEETHCDVKGGLAGDIAVFAGTLSYRTPDWSIGLFAVDVRKGKEIWRVRTDLEDAMSLKMTSDGERAYVFCWSRVLAFDIATGKRAWERRLGRREANPSRGTQLVAGLGVVVFWESYEAVHIADAATGRELVTIPWRGFVGDLVLRDGVLYVVPMWGNGPEAIAAFDAVSGRALWRHEDANRWAVPPALVDDDTIYVRRADDTTLALNDHGTEVVALDRATGALVWKRPLGRTNAIALVPSSDGPPTLVVEAMGRETIAFARAERPEKPVSVTISGVVRAEELTPMTLAGLRVKVGDAIATTDTAGRFTARVTAAGAVEVKLMDLPVINPKPVAPVVSEATFVNVDRLSEAYSADVIVHEVKPWPRD